MKKELLENMKTNVILKDVDDRKVDSLTFSVYE